MLARRPTRAATAALALLLLGPLVTDRIAASPPRPTEQGQARRPREDDAGEEARRKALWKALLQALPEKYREIDAYAEDDALTRVLFRSRRTTLVFSLKEGVVEEVRHMKGLGRINRITYDPTERTFKLWLNGELELTLG